MLDLLYRNPRLLILSVGIIIVAGLSSYQALPRLEDPHLLSRWAKVTVLFPGAGAERSEELVTKKLEDAIREVPEISEIVSQSRSGVTTLILELGDDVHDVDEVWSRVRNKIGDAQDEFPYGVLEPDFEVIDSGSFALMVALCWTQDSEPNYATLRRLAKDFEDVLRGVRGTSKVRVVGDPNEEILVEIEAEKLATLGLTARDVAEQIRASDAKVSAGVFRSGKTNVVLQIESELDSLERIARIPIQCVADGRFVQVGDIAQIRKGITEPVSDLAIVSGQPAIVLAVRMSPDLRIDRWTEAARAALSQAELQLPHEVRLHTVFEQNHYVQKRLVGLYRNLAFGAGAVTLVMLLMMGWRSSLIVAGLALPLTVLMVVAGLKFMGIPIHQMSVSGLILALGLLIDNAIIAVDAVRENLRSGHSPQRAVVLSVRHLAIPLFGSTLTTALAFAPLALLPGSIGEFVGAIAVSVILAIFASLLLSLTVIPTVTAMSSSRKGGDSNSWWNHGVSLPRLTAWYRRTLDGVVARPVYGILLGAALPVSGFLVAGTLAEQFFPPEDRDQFQIEVHLAPQSSVSQTVGTVKQAREFLLDYDEVRSVDWFVGRSAPSFFYNLLARQEHAAPYAQAIVRTASAASPELLRRVQADLDGKFPGARTLVKQLEQGPPFDAPVEVRIFGPDIERLRDAGEQVRQILAKIPEVTHTSADLSETKPRLALVVDEEQARLAGLNHATISHQLDTALEGAVGGSVVDATEELPIRVRVSNRERADLGRIASLDLVSQVPNAERRQAFVPLTALTSIDLVPELAIIPRRDGRRVNEVKAYIQAGVLPDVVLDQLKQSLAEFELPPGYSLSFGGEAAERNHAVANLMTNVAPLLVLMISSLVLSFKSFRMAAIIGVVGVLSIGLGFGTLWLFQYSFGFMAIIGTMGLVGLAINDSIVVLAALQADTNARQGDARSVREVIVRSTRHVLSTSLTTMAGFTPLVLWGGQLWPPLAITIAAGVAGATLLALYFVPAAYLLVCTTRGATSGDGPHRRLRSSPLVLNQQQEAA